MCIPANLGEEFAKVENALIQLENVCEEEDLAKEKATHDLALEKYRRKKLTELEKVKGKRCIFQYYKQTFFYIG